MRELIVGSYVRGGRVVNDCARACMHACVCGFTYRQKDDLFHKLRYDGINKVYHIIYLSFRISLFLTIHIRTYTHTTHTYIYVCVCVCLCLDALTLDEEKNFIYLRLLHIKR